MAAKTTKIVVRVMPNHPNGVRNRAGFKFGVDPSTVEVTAEQLEQIKADPFLKILEKGSAFEQGLKRPGKKAGTPEQQNASSDADAGNGEGSDSNPANTVDGNDAGAENDGADTGNGDDAGNDTGNGANGETEKPISKMNKTELVEALTKKGLEAGKDFDPEAKNDDLKELLSSL